MEETLIRLAKQYELLFNQSEILKRECIEKRKKNVDDTECSSKFYKNLESLRAVRKLFMRELIEYTIDQKYQFIKINGIIYGYYLSLIRITPNELKVLK